MLQQLLGSFYPCLLKVFNRRKTCCLFKPPYEVAPARWNISDQFFNGVGILVLYFNFLLHLLYKVITVIFGRCKSAEIFLLFSVHIDRKNFCSAHSYFAPTEYFDQADHKMKTV